MMTLLSGFPLISLLLIIPLIAALLIWVTGLQRYARIIALLANLVVLMLAAVLLYAFDPSSAAFQFVEKTPWISSLNIHYSVGIDGISILFLPLTAILFGAIVIASWTSVHTLTGLYYTLLLLLESAMLGIFTALDTMLFFVFWELTLIPIC